MPGKRLTETDIEVRERILELYLDPIVKANLKALKMNIRAKEMGFFKSGMGKFHSYYSVKKNVKLIFVPNDRNSELLFLEFISDKMNLYKMEAKIVDGMKHAFTMDIAPHGLTVVELPVLEL